MKVCDGNKHNLLEVYEHYDDAMGGAVVRWCENCGAIVIDRDFDNKTFPGYYVAMKFPTMTFPNQRKKA
jgi:hypothetical protein